MCWFQTSLRMRPLPASMNLPCARSEQKVVGLYSLKSSGQPSDARKTKIGDSTNATRSNKPGRCFRTVLISLAGAEQS